MTAAETARNEITALRADVVNDPPDAVRTRCHQDSIVAKLETIRSDTASHA
jgi:hypothetical protein